jgi:hypothetical protein
MAACLLDALIPEGKRLLHRQPRHGERSVHCNNMSNFDRQINIFLEYVEAIDEFFARIYD